MAELFQNLPPAIQALSADIVTWLLTALGAAAVFVFKTMNDKILNTMQGFAAGIMIAASFWSLLQPAIEYNEDGAIPWLPAAIGFLLGGIFIRGLDFVIPHIHRNATDEHQQREGVKTKSLNKSTLLVLAITLHNIPEGLSIGVAFGGVVSGNGQATLLGALGLSVFRTYLKVRLFLCRFVQKVRHSGKRSTMVNYRPLSNRSSRQSVQQPY